MAKVLIIYAAIAGVEDLTLDPESFKTLNFSNYGIGPKNFKKIISGNVGLNLF